MNDENLEPEKSEYEYSGGEDYSNLYGGKTDKSGFMEWLKKRRLLAIIILVVILVAGYKLIGFFTTSKPSKTTTVTKQSTPDISKITTTQKQPIEKTPTATSIQDTQVTTRSLTDSDDQQVSQIKQQISSINDQLNQFAIAMSNLQSNLSDISNQLSSMNESLDDVKQSLKKPTKKKVIKGVSQLKKPRVLYYVRAIIPGRAWLKSSDGESTTVAVGDPIPNYGVVRVIDAKRGIVVTSTGAVIRYAIEEE